VTDGLTPANISDYLEAAIQAMPVAAGTAAAPSIAPTGDTNTGLYFPAADQVAISTAGVQRVLVNLAGLNVDGIGIGMGAGAISTNTAVGAGALESNTAGTVCTANGYYALQYNTTGYANSAYGERALWFNKTGFNNIAIGNSALRPNTTGNYNTAIGVTAMGGPGITAGAFQVGTVYIIDTVGTTDFTTVGAASNTVATIFTATGAGSGTGIVIRANTGSYNTAIGQAALFSNTTGSYNTASGHSALNGNTTGSSNTASGLYALFSNTTGDFNTASGQEALGNNVHYSNTGGFGYNAQVTGSNQIQLGNSATTTYVYGSVANRSDERDKTDIKDTELGLNFVMKLRPVDYRWDYREDYKPERPVDIEPLKQDATEEEKAAYEVAKAEHDKAIQSW
jgi:hypothetical protein